MAPIDLGLTLHLEGNLTIARAPALQELISNAISNDDQIIVDCSNATEADLTIIQLLISAKHTAAAFNKSLSLIAPADGVLAAAICRSAVPPSELPSIQDPTV